MAIGSKSDPQPPVVMSAAAWTAEMDRMAERKTPSFFHIRGRLPTQGRTNQVLGASTNMNVVLKTYASGGENELHAHSNEDHLFVIMQGSATFVGPNDEKKVVEKNDCVLVPSNSFYWFHANEGEPLVMLRVGATLDVAKDVLARIGPDGQPFDGYSERNKEVPLVLSEDGWFE